MSENVEKNLFGVRTLIRTREPDRDDGLSAFEERVVIIEAISFDEAIALGEAEAKRYVSELPSSSSPHLLDDVQAFELSPDPISPGSEVWSVIRRLKMTDDEFSDYLYKGDGVRALKSEAGTTTTPDSSDANKGLL